MPQLLRPGDIVFATLLDAQVRFVQPILFARIKKLFIERINERITRMKS